MAKASRPGLTKTRLIPTLGADGRGAAQHRLPDRRGGQHGRCRTTRWRGYAAFGPPDARGFFSLLFRTSIGLVDAWCPDFGDTLMAAMTGVLARKATSAACAHQRGQSDAAAGACWPQAAERLLARRCDLVLGPADDGGYYLIGAREVHRGLFTGMTWSVDSVFAETMARRAEALGLAVDVLPTWYDVDDAASLAVAARGAVRGPRDFGPAEPRFRRGPRHARAPRRVRPTAVAGRPPADMKRARRSACWRSPRPRCSPCTPGSPVRSTPAPTISSTSSPGSRRCSTWWPSWRFFAMTRSRPSPAPSSRALVFILVVAALLRVPCCCSRSPVSTDLYRYIWDGRVQGRRHQPLSRSSPPTRLWPSCAMPRSTPGSTAPTPRTRSTRRWHADGLLPGHAESGRASRLMKTTMVGCEAAAIWAILRLLRRRGAACRPASCSTPGTRCRSGNSPAAATSTRSRSPACSLGLLAAEACGARSLAGAALAGLLLTKFFPVVVGPALYRRWGWRLPAAFVVTDRSSATFPISASAPRSSASSAAIPTRRVCATGPASTSGCWLDHLVSAPARERPSRLYLAGRGPGAGGASALAVLLRARRARRRHQAGAFIVGAQRRDGAALAALRLVLLPGWCRFSRSSPRRRCSG